MTTISAVATAAAPPTNQAVDAARAAQAVMAAQKVGAAVARAADGDYKVKGPGHMVKDADGDYKPTVTGASATPAPQAASATQAALTSLVKGG